MSDNAEPTTTNPPVDTVEKVVTPSPDDKSDVPPKTTFGDVNVSSPVRLFGQFKQNGTNTSSSTPAPIFGQLTLKDRSSNSSPTNNTASYFTSTLSKISSSATSSAGGGGFGSSSTPLATSLASLGANKPLFGGSSGTTPSSFTDLKTPGNTQTMPSSTNSDQDDDEDADDDDKHEQTNKTVPSLLETAAEYEAKRASTQHATTIHGDTSTGEEHEITKFQMAGKLYIYNGEQQQFVERGYGILKINECIDPSDWDRLQARLIMRLDKSFRVILNSPIVPKMTVERASDRSVRFGAQDESHLRVFIIKATANDCANLCKELQSRIQIVERQHEAAAVAKPNVESPPNNASEAPNLDDSNDTSPYRNLPAAVRKRSHSKSDSDTSDNANDLSKKSKLVEGGHRDVDKNRDESTSDDSVESIKTGEEETTS